MVTYQIWQFGIHLHFYQSSSFLPQCVHPIEFALNFIELLEVPLYRRLRFLVKIRRRKYFPHLRMYSMLHKSIWPRMRSGIGRMDPYYKIPNTSLSVLLCLYCRHSDLEKGSRYASSDLIAWWLYTFAVVSHSFRGIIFSHCPLLPVEYENKCHLYVINIQS